MTRGRVEAFSDGVIAILITIMVLEMKVPHGTDAAALRPVLPVFLSYVLSFIYLGIYWNNHHHLFHAVRRVSGGILWANLHLLFWLSLIPFVTGWMGENHFARLPAALYGVVLLCAAGAYYILTRTLLAHHEPDSPIARALRSRPKEKISIVLYATAIALSALSSMLACALYVAVAIMWLVPDRRIEQMLTERAEKAAGVDE
jgi:uncharacterized membrane protein